MIPLKKVVDLREPQKRLGPKSRAEYEARQAEFIAKRNPGQKTPASGTETVTQPAQLKTQMEAGHMFYGDDSRHDKDAIAWMQALNAKKVANDWSDKKAIDIFKSLLAEEKHTWKW